MNLIFWFIVTTIVCLLPVLFSLAQAACGVLRLIFQVAGYLAGDGKAE